MIIVEERLNKILENVLEGDYLEYVLEYCKNIALQGDHGTSAEDVYSVMSTMEKLELFQTYIDELVKEVSNA